MTYSQSDIFYHMRQQLLETKTTQKTKMADSDLNANLVPRAIRVVTWQALKLMNK